MYTRKTSEFVRWVTVSAPDPDAWVENELFCESYGFRNNGPNERDKHKHGIYQKDLNGDMLDPHINTAVLRIYRDLTGGMHADTAD